MIPEHHEKNFQTLLKATKQKRVCLLEVQEVATGAQRVALCAVNFEETPEKSLTIAFMPMALMIEGNPFELLRCPKPEGGFYPAPQEKAKEAEDAG